MILVDTSVWIDHLRDGDAHLARLLNRASVLGHPWVTGELALGGLRHRAQVIKLLMGLPQADVATAEELLMFIEREQLYGCGIGYVDAALLAATRLTPGSALWARDKRLSTVADRLGVRYEP